MLYSLILLLVPCVRQSYVVAEGTYECGQHGRFEYCINEIPGCIIGCHCHPGYYFDTESKICEPNSKLLQHNRRQNVGGRTRILKMGATSDAAFETETAATVDNIHGPINEMTKDADDLGDWLYNQFFKTIESQVVNNTNDKEVLTRRSGTGYKIKKPERTSKWYKKPKSYKRSRNDRLKKKLLRITENDSLFDITSGSSSDSSESTSSDSSEEVHIKNHDDDNEHGHKKIVMINKKQKPPLPNFIFLPNLDTSFYPPLGLPPPPPIVPMYPMVPVPPVVPLFRLQVPENSVITTTSNNDITTTTTETKRTTSDLTSETAKSETITSTEPSTSTDLPSTVPSEIKDDPIKTLRGMRERKRKEAKQRNKNLDTGLGLGHWKSSGRQKLLQQLKGKINKTPKLLPFYNEKTNLIKTPFMNQENEDGVPLLDNNLPDDIINEIQPLQAEISPIPENVDFKYITELIHRVDLKNKTDRLPTIDYNPLDSIEVYRPPRSDKNNYYRYYNSPTDTFVGRRTNRPVAQQQTNDLYYTNLGRQIATMIRGIESQNDQIKLEMEGTNQKLNNDPYFNMDKQKSFWERSVRSPLTYLNANKSKYEYLKKSNEILFNIENKVEIMASTVPALSLQEIENIVKVMEAAKMDSNIQVKNPNIRNPIASNKSLNINLWPQEVKITNKNKQEETLRKPVDNNENGIISKNVQTNNAHDILMHNFHRYNIWHDPRAIENTKHMQQFPEIKSTKKPSIGNTYFVSDPLSYNPLRHDGDVNQIRHPQSNSLLHKPIPHPLLENLMNPLFLRHRKYFQGNNNFVFNQNANMSHPQPAQTSLLRSPSYFHQHTNYFDYFLMTSPAISKSPEKRKSESKSPTHSTHSEQTPSNADVASTSSGPPPSDPFSWLRIFKLADLMMKQGC